MIRLLFFWGYLKAMDKADSRSEIPPGLLFSRIATFVYFELPALVILLLPVPTSPSKPSANCPAAASTKAIVNHGFVPARADLIEVAAFMDRTERHAVSDDFRCIALREAAALLVDGQPNRVRRILEKLSDPTTEPAATSSSQAALGAWLPPVAPGSLQAKTK